jgi:hypothetical protein
MWTARQSAYILLLSLLKRGFRPGTADDEDIEFEFGDCWRIPSWRLSCCWLFEAPPPKPPPGKPPEAEKRPELNDDGGADDVGVTRPPPTVELNPIGPPDVLLCWEVTAARDNWANEDPLRFKFCNEPIPEKINITFKLKRWKKKVFDEINI